MNTMSATVEFFTLAADGPLIPSSTPTKIPNLDGPVSKIFGYGLWLLILAGVGGTGFGVYKLAVSDKSRSGGGAEPFKGMGGGGAAVAGARFGA
ncbi:hypothetical protein, partial [Actinomadura kijaniata]|uniref:hypothetical protein n=1 Tax=Actinomadura kijaniata TaxID=46161 RepID=UPI0031DFB102